MPDPIDPESSGCGPFAHTKPGLPPSGWEPLATHLAEVSKLAAEFAGAFDAADLAALAGKWHDLGKYSLAFQRYLRLSASGCSPSRGPDHSTAGALHAVRQVRGNLGQCLAFLIAGHHAGLADLGTPEDPDGSCLKRRLSDPPEEAVDAIQRASDEIKAVIMPKVPRWITSPGGTPLRLSLFVRMLFSCLIDADRLATEAFCDSDRAAQRRSVPAPSIGDLQQVLDAHIDRLSEKSRGSRSPVAACRASLLADCRGIAQRSPGLYSLTAPTGCGKTLSSMSFALRHAASHGMRRVIYALPFTSVTEQNAAVLREALGQFGSKAVLEHHSAYRSPWDGSTEETRPDRVWHRLMVENWDAPVIVTTNVRLLESLFASGASDCRKLHRIAKSVIVLDEAQTLPVQMLKPTLTVLRELASSYGCTIVLCSATMPAVTHRSDFPIGLSPVQEIVSDPIALERSMRRVAIQRVGGLTDESLLDRIAPLRQALVVVNTRPHAARLFRALRGRGVPCVHLSGLLCPEHRTAVVAQVKERLRADAQCVVISTQVVEAGVDIDFPVVFRGMAGLDSIIQAAGRCNREGRLPTCPVFVFDTEERAPGEIGRGALVTAQVLKDGVDPVELRTIEDYFRLLYWDRQDEWDGGIGADGRSVGITDELLSPARLAFRDAARAYRIVDDGGQSTPVVVPYQEAGKEMCDRLRRPARGDRSILGAAQRFTVNARRWYVDKALETGVCEQTECGAVILLESTRYDPELGLLLDGSPPSPETLSV